MKTTKRFLSMVLMLAMLVSMFTVMAFADGEIKDDNNDSIVIVNVGQNGSVSKGNKTYNSRFIANTGNKLTATPNSGYEAKWYYSALKYPITDAGYFDNGALKVDENMTEGSGELYVEFTQNDSGSAVNPDESETEHTVVVNIVNDGHGPVRTKGTSEGFGSIYDGAEIKLTPSGEWPLVATPEENYEVSWKLNKTTAVTGNEYTLKNITADSVLTITFTEKEPQPEPSEKHTLTVKADRDSKGYIKYSQKEDSSITFNLEKNKTVTVTAVAKDGYRFEEWKVSGDAKLSNIETETTTVTMGDKDSTVTAIFKETTEYGNCWLDVDIHNPRYGTVRFEDDNNVADGKDFWLEDGETYTIYATADRGYTAYWYYNGTWDYGGSFTFKMDEDENTLRVEFVRDGYRPSRDDSHTLTIDITGEKHGTVKRGTTKIYDGYTMSLDKNDTRTFKAAPDKGYVTVWTFRGESYVGNEFTVKMGSKNATLYIEFMDEDDYRLWNLPFRDVSERDWFYSDVAYVYANGYMEGISSTKFAPKQNTTRAQIVTILWRLTGEPRAMRSNKFNDVSSSAYYDQAVSWAVEAGVVNGFDAKTFKPNDYVTREQLAAILYRYAEYMNLSTRGASNLSNYNDYYKIGSWARDAMAWANYHGLINGVSYSRIDPKGYATRAQIAAILHRFAVEFGNY